MTDKKLGKITAIKFGFGGYQDAMFGVTVSMDGAGWGTVDFRGTWADPPSSGAKWTAEDQAVKFAEVTQWIMGLLRGAKVFELNKLVGIPVEVEFVDSTLKNWRILQEVI